MVLNPLYLIVLLGVATAFMVNPVGPFFLSRHPSRIRLCCRLHNKRSGNEEDNHQKEEGEESDTKHEAQGAVTGTTTIQAGQVSITESDFPGAGLPRPDLAPDEIPKLLMTALRHNDFPEVDSGLTSVWAFSGDTTRHIFQNNFTDFVESAMATALEFNTSFYAVAMNGQAWEMETPLNRVGGKEGWIATQVMKTITSDGRLRRWQWELRKNRRPPNLGCWYVESIGSSDRKGQFEPE